MMVKSSTAVLRELRDQVFRRDSHRCVWPGCGSTEDLQLAHITHRGMGGSREANRPDNVCCMCRRHHDLLDGRTSLGTLRWELNELLRYVISDAS